MTSQISAQSNSSCVLALGLPIFHLSFREINISRATEHPSFCCYLSTTATAIVTYDIIFSHSITYCYTSMSTTDKVKILVVGDSGVGKSSLVHLICHGQPIQSPSWTIGCSVEVKLHEYKEGTPMEKNYFVELWDVGGSNSHRNSRSIFYNLVHGILLVHDLTNRKSQQNLRKWLAEILNKEGNSKMKNESSFDYDPEQFVDCQIPNLVVGTKQDLSQVVRSNQSSSMRSSSFAEECGADEIYLDCRQAKALAPGSSNAVKISRFFDKVIESRYHAREGHIAASFLDRRRLFPPTSKAFHTD